MRLEIPRETERIGAVQIYGLQKVYELDSGPDHEAIFHREDSVIQRISYESLFQVEKEMAIVVPVKDERLKLIEGVLCGIPNQCTTIVVSNSERSPIDRFQIEQEAIRNFAKFTGQKILLVHQKDPILAKAFTESGYEELIDDKGLIRNGKAEGMILGTLLAKTMGKKFVGFVDSDNYFPGAVNEYVKEYAAGFNMCGETNTFVRISWQSKPKVQDSSLYFAKWGRSTVQTNRVLNRLISMYSGFETEIIKTGNAGEHALSLDLAMDIDYAAGYAVETYHFVNILERFGGLIPEQQKEPGRNAVKICQIQSRNPHLHEVKGDEHVEDMISASWRAIYHSDITPQPLKDALRAEMEEKGYLVDGEIQPVKRYPALNKINLGKFSELVEEVLQNSDKNLFQGFAASPPISIAR
ncbi:MAG: mannosyl-3-phosphoglycerate synthase [Opitutales bacterium]|nr:mannosyl-3-phosphoglycerate synthase [Opitutales bacterium]MCH8540398.1 mannosyl-3-phosphoglycerate synthase [Opitutales bacterium]